ncbi:TonB-dependent receptor [Gimibacter soli]|uniref:TonB-dependent receptor n=1 Tax=Gimibacter soli TaxID=3024400 RepID=A0AAE9XSU5_9PROT|nr:TonB-dependent receptor [Gimibacter soli]WCL53435.1 TonB-dependent receptor [Gimibacter soli]
MTSIKSRLRGASSTYVISTVMAAATILVPAAAANAAGQQESSVIMIEEVVVTARKREENMQDTPIAVSAFSEKALERQQINGTTDLDRITPGLQFTSYGQLSGNNSAAQVFIRGIGQVDPTGAVDPGVGIYVDDVYMGRSVGGAMDFNDVANVQVLRGPQGTLFGRNTIGGAVILTSNTPGDELGGSAKVRIGSDNQREFSVAADLPLGETLKSRVSVSRRTRDGYVTRLVDGLDLGDTDNWAVKGALRWTPSADVTVTVRADYSKADENGSPFVFKEINPNAAFVAAVSVGAGCPGATFPPPSTPEINDPRCANNFWNLGPFTNGGNADVSSKTENWGLSGVIDWTVNDNVSLKSVTAYRDLTWSGVRDADNTPFTILTTDYSSVSKQFSQEFQALFEFGALHGVAGLYYFDEDTNDYVTVFLGAPPPVVAAGGVGSRDLQIVDLSTESWAGFTEWTYDVSDRFSVSGGLRYTEETKGMQLIAFNIFPSTLPDPDPLPTSTPALFVEPDLFETDFSSMTGTLKAQYRWSDSLMTYASWSQGFKSGGYNQRYNAPPPGFLPIAFDEERATNLEAGFKADINRVFRLNGALFHTKYKDIQLIYRLGVVPLLFNAGSATIDGAELEMAFVPTDRFMIEGSLGYLDSKIDEITEVPGTTATVGPDNRLPFTPKWKGNIGVSYVFPLSGDLELTPRVDLSYTASQFFDAANSIEVAQDKGVTLVNASLRLAEREGGWNLTFGIENLTDELYPVAGNSSLSTATGYAEIIYARKRTWFLSAGLEF